MLSGVVGPGGLTVRTKALVNCAATESVTVTLKGYDPLETGTPVIVPPVEMFNGAGSPV